MAVFTIDDRQKQLVELVELNGAHPAPKPEKLTIARDLWRRVFEARNHVDALVRAGKSPDQVVCPHCGQSSWGYEYTGDLDTREILYSTVWCCQTKWIPASRTAVLGRRIGPRPRLDPSVPMKSPTEPTRVPRDLVYVYAN